MEPISMKGEILGRPLPIVWIDVVMEITTIFNLPIRPHGQRQEEVLWTTAQDTILDVSEEL